MSGGILTGYYDIGLRALSAARLGLQISGQNIANASTPGYSRRRVDLNSGFPISVTGGYIDSGVNAKISRPASRLIQASLEREQGNLAGSEERLRGLQDIELLFGGLEGETIGSAYADFTDRFAELSGQPESTAQRRAAITAADNLASRIRSVYEKLDSQQQLENETVSGHVNDINRLADELASLNKEISGLESGGDVAGGLRDRRDQVLGELTELTGGYAYRGENDRVLFSLQGGPTLVTSSKSIPLGISLDAAGLSSVSSGGIDITDRLRDGKLGAVLEIRDDQVPARQAELDALAADLITRANAITTAGTDLDGNPGVALFDPDPPAATGAGRLISVSAGVLANPRELAISTTGLPGDGAGALALSEIRGTGSAALGNTSPADYYADIVTQLGTSIVQADVDANVAGGLVDNLQAQRDAVSGVSLDEEAVDLLKHQQAYEAAARFMQTLNEVTQITMTIGQ